MGKELGRIAYDEDYFTQAPCKSTHQIALRLTR